MKKVASLILAVLLCLSALLCFASCGNNQDEIVIGVFEPASGDNGAGGKQETLGIKYANDVKKTVKVGGKEYNVKLVFSDNQSSNEKAISAATNLISKNSVVVLGSYGSGVSIAASDTFKEAGLPAIGVTCTNPKVTEGNSHYFRVCFLDPFQGTVLANYAKELGATKAYVLAEKGNDYDTGLASYFKKAFGEDACTYTEFPKGTTDFANYLQTAIETDCSVIFAPTSLSYAQLIIDTAKSKKYTGTLLAGDTWDSNVITNAAKDTELKVQVTTFYQEGANKDFDEGFVNWLKDDAQRKNDNGGDYQVSAVSAMGYDAYMTALAAIEKCEKIGTVKENRAAIMKALAGMTTVESAYKGVTGTIYFDATGDCVRDSAFIKQVDVATGVWKFVKEQKKG